MRRFARKGTIHKSVRHEIADLGVTRLATIGAISLTWNSIEDSIEMNIGLILELFRSMWDEVSSRINGFDGKIALIKVAAKESVLLPTAYYLPICSTLSALEEHKKYRDAVIHVRIQDPAAPVAPSHKNKGRQLEVLITPEALIALLERLTILEQEVNRITLIIVSIRAHRGRMGTTPTEDEKRQAEEDAQQHLAQLRGFQSQRAAMSPLPEFPSEPEAPPVRATPPSPPDEGQS